MGTIRKHLTYSDRLKIEAWHKIGISAPEIARYLGVHYSTIYRDLKRGKCKQLTSQLVEYETYSADLAQRKINENTAMCGRNLAIGNNHALAQYIETKIKAGYSPYAIVEQIKRQKLFENCVSVSTIYNYVHNGIFLTVTTQNLPYKPRQKKQCKINHYNIKNPLAQSIETRPEDIFERDEFGHWEMDTVVGKQKTKPCLLVLTERKTRFEIIRKMKDKTANSTVCVLDSLEKKYGKSFSKIFKTITVDNGSEFANALGMQRSVFNNSKRRTSVYYCHPYSAYERGSNENNNKLIRRHYPKGTSFEKVSQKDIRQLQDWINCYPRKLLQGYSSQQYYSHCESV